MYRTTFCSFIFAAQEVRPAWAPPLPEVELQRVEQPIPPDNDQRWKLITTAAGPDGLYHTWLFTLS